MEEGQPPGQPYEWASVSPLLSVFGCSSRYWTWRFGNVALGACSATGQTTTKPINAFPEMLQTSLSGPESVRQLDEGLQIPALQPDPRQKSAED